MNLNTCTVKSHDKSQELHWEIMFLFLNFASECRLLPLRLRPDQLPLTARTFCVVARGEGGDSGGERGRWV